jgi:DNA-binding beta-propeller fold protein YncE
MGLQRWSRGVSVVAAIAMLGSTSPARARAAAPCRPPDADHIGYVSNLADNTISAIDLDTLTVARTFGGFDYPFNQEISDDGSQLFVDNSRITDLLHNFVARVDPCTDKIVQKYPSQGVPFSSLSIDGRYVYSTPSSGPQHLAGGPVLQIDAHTGELMRKIMLPLPGPLHTTSYDNTVLWVASQPALVYRVDAKTLKMIGSPILTCGLPAVVRLSPDGRTLITLDSEDCLTVINTATGQATRIPTFPQGNPAFGSFTPDGKYFWAGGYSGQVWVLDVAERKIVKHFDLGGFSVGVNISRDGRQAFVSTTPPGTVFGPLNQAFLALAVADAWRPGGQVDVFDTNTYDLIKTITVGNVPMLVSIPKGPFARRPTTTTTSATPCTPRGWIRIHLATRGGTIAAVSASVAGHRVHTHRVGRNGVAIDLRQRADRRVVVRIRARLTNGHRVATTRTYRLCDARNR